MNTINFYEAKTNLFQRVEHAGPRTLGLWANQGYAIADNFDDPLSLQRDDRRRNRRQV